MEAKNPMQLTFQATFLAFFRIFWAHAAIKRIGGRGAADWARGDLVSPKPEGYRVITR